MPDIYIYTIHLVDNQTHQTLHVFPCRSGESVLQAMRRANISLIPRGCGGGGCGACKVQILNGRVTSRRMSCAHITPSDRANNRALACCIQPKSNIELTVCDTQLKQYEIQFKK